MKTLKSITIFLGIIISILVVIGVSNNIDAQNAEKARVEIINKEKEKQDSIKQFANDIQDSIGENSSVSYDSSRKIIYITVKYHITDNFNEFVSQYSNADENGKKQLREKFGIAKLQEDSMNLYNDLNSKQKQRNYNVKFRITVQNNEQTDEYYSNIFRIDNGKFEDMISNNKKQSQSDNTLSKATYKARFGNFLDGNINQNVLVVKFKIEPKPSNTSTIHQNGYNIEDMILNQGADKYDEIQYWAVADMQDDSESKVISFTVDKNLITKIKNKQVVGNQIVDYAKDVWILPSLK